MSPIFSIIIPTHNNVKVLTECLQHWQRVHLPFPIEVLVIEDGCSDGTADYLRAESETAWGRLTLRWFHEDDVHELRCDNRGFREARGTYLLPWQDDMFIKNDWLLLELERTFAKHPDIGLIALSRGLHCLWVNEPVTTWEELLDWRRLQSTIGPAPWNWFNLYEVDAVVRPWAVRRACLDKVGILDEAFAPCEWDEADLCYRMREQGWKSAAHGYERGGAYEHLGSTTMSKTPSDRQKAVALKNGKLFLDRWKPQIIAQQNRQRAVWRRSLTVSTFLHAIGKAIKRAKKS